MNAYITLKSGKELLVSDISVIKYEATNGELTECRDFSSFTLYDENYIFIGGNIVTLDGSDVLCVNFMKS